MSVAVQINRTVDLNLQPIRKTELTNLFVKGNVQAHQFNITVKKDGVAESLAAGSCSAIFVNASKQTVPLSGSVSSNVASVTLNSACYAVAGRFYLVINATVSGITQAVFYGIGSIAPSETDVVIDPDDMIPSLAELLAMVDDMETLSDSVTAAEALRVTAENGRVSAENTRVSHENARVTAENSRVSAESARVTAEGLRVTAESGRVSAENGRVSAENGRVSAESARVSAESLRQSNTAQAISDCEDAMDDADASAAAANAAAAAVAGQIAAMQDQADAAEAAAAEAVEQVEDIQSQVDLLVVEGDSSVEAAQARVPVIGSPYTTLKARLDHAEETMRAIVTVKQFYESGDTDWTAAFTRGITYIKANGGGTLVVPPGEYLVQPDTIELCSHLELLGIGRPKVYTDYGEPYDKMIGYDESGIEDVRICGILFDQFSEVGTYDFSTLKTRIISISYNTGDFTIEDCDFNFVGVWAISMWSHDIDAKVYIRNNRINFRRQYDGYYDISCVYVESFYHDFEGNTLRNITPEAYAYNTSGGGMESHGHQGHIRENDIGQQFTAGFNVANGDTNYTTRRGVRIIENNNIHDVQNGIKLWPLSADTGISNLVIRNNYIGLAMLNPFTLDGVSRYTTLCGVGLVDNGGTLENIKIIGNKIEFLGEVPEAVPDEWEYDIPLGYLGGVNIAHVNNFEIAGNEFVNLPCPAINTYISSTESTNGRIHDNIIINCFRMNALTPDIIGGAICIGAVTNAEIYGNTILFDDTIDYEPEDVFVYRAFSFRGYSGATNLPTGVYIRDTKFISGTKFESQALSDHYYDTDDNHSDLECMRYFKNEDPKLDGVSAQAVPTSGNFAVGDRLLYDAETQTRTYTVTANALSGDVFTLNGVTLIAGTDFTPGSNNTETAGYLAAALDSALDPKFSVSADGAVITVTQQTPGSGYIPGESGTNGQIKVTDNPKFGFRGYKCTGGGTAGTAACTVSQIEISSDTRWVLYKIESGDVPIGAWTIVEGHGSCQGIVVSKAVASDTYTYIVVREFYNWASAFTGTAALLYVAPTFTIMA